MVKLKYVKRYAVEAITAFFLVTIVFFTSCDPGIFSSCEQEYYFDRDNTLAFVILDQTNQNVLEILNTPYSYDTVKVYSTDWEVVYPIGDWYAKNGVIDLAFINRNDIGVVNEPIGKRYYMYFHRNDIDTIDIVFRMKYDKCDHQIIDYCKISYNNRVYYDEQTDHVPYMKFFKND